jgi:uncharacterized protein (DUF2252 family)
MTKLDMPTRLGVAHPEATLEHYKVGDGTSQHQEHLRGVAARKILPRDRHSVFTPVKRDPLVILERQNSQRLADLVPLRMARMLENPFTFYRGTAGIMAADLALGPDTGARLSICGDAHIGNFGFFASPERNLVFDLNDFDEAATGPWEWDLKRMVTSVVVAGQNAGFDAKFIRTATLDAARGYREFLRDLVHMPMIDRYYFRSDEKRWEAITNPEVRAVIDKAAKDAHEHTSYRVVKKLTSADDSGAHRFVPNPPVLTPVSDVVRANLAAIHAAYLGSVRNDIRVLLEQFTLTDVARRVVGVGSVGTRCFLMLFTGPIGDPLVLQVKEAELSVIETDGGIVQPADPLEMPSRDIADDIIGDLAEIPGRAGADTPNQGLRVINNQRVQQAVSDPFLGYMRVNGHDFYVRQFQDMKGSVDASTLSREVFPAYGWLCGRMLARAHAQSSEAAYVSGYLGSSTKFDEAVTKWAHAYAEQSLADFHALEFAVATGRISAE